jgi:nucleoside-diphosphate-sugar epimerase
MRVLVTGATGFVGARLVQQVLNEGHEVWAAVRPGGLLRSREPSTPQLCVAAADLRDRSAVHDLVARAQPECCVHLAWYVVPGEFWDSPANLGCVSMTLGLAEELAAAGCRRLVAAGSCAEYDWSDALLSEDATPLLPQTFYGVCKNSTRQILDAYCHRVGIRLAWTRYFFLYGPGEKPRRLVPAVIRALLRGEPARLNSGQQVRDFLHVDDVAAATWAVAKSDLTGAVNVASGVPVRITDLVETIANQMGGRPQLDWGAVPDGPRDVPRIVADVRRLRQATGWSPSLSLEAGIRNTIEWWKAHLNPI